jgi:hypothetical protein
MNQQQYEVEFNKRVTAILKELIFPAENIPEGVRDYLLLSLPCSNHYALQCSLDEFEEVADYAGNGGDIKMTTAFIALQIVRGVTAKDVGLNLAVYCQMNRLFADMAIAWEVIAGPFKEKIAREIGAEYEKSQKNKAINGKRPSIILSKA